VIFLVIAVVAIAFMVARIRYHTQRAHELLEWAREYLERNDR
jgi:hypothetical protein